MDSYSGLRQKIRAQLCDASAYRYTDQFLNSLIDKAQSEYSLDTLKLTRDFECVSINGTVTLPEDFIVPNRFTDSLGSPVCFINFSRLIDSFGTEWKFHHGKVLHSICFDCCSFGEFKTYPMLPDGVIGTLNYARLPIPFKLEIKDEEALCAWVRFYIGLIENTPEAGVSFDAYTKLICRVRSDYAAARVHKRSGGVFF